MQDRAEIGTELANIVDVERVRLMDQPHAELVVHRHRDGERIVRRLGCGQQRELGIGADAARVVVDLIVLEHDQAVEQAISPRDFGPLLDLLERRVLVLREIELRLL